MSYSMFKKMTALDDVIWVADEQCERLPTKQEVWLWRFSLDSVSFLRRSLERLRKPQPPRR